jgi:hypothetical protein
MGLPPFSPEKLVYHNFQSQVHFFYGKSNRFSKIMNETISHILTECNFTEAVRNIVTDKFNLPSYSSLSASGKLVSSVKALARLGPKERTETNIGILISFGGWSGRKEIIESLKAKNCQPMQIRPSSDG